MRIIGVTGGVGSGKSRVLQIMEERYGAHVIRADEVAHRLMEPGEEAYRKVLEEFGSPVLDTDGRLDKTKLSALIFGDREVRRRMDSIVHPLVWRAIEQEIRAAGGGLTVVETAIPEKKLGDICDELWYVYTSRENRILRLSENRGYPAEKSISIMESQVPDEIFREMSDHVIDNNGSLRETEKQLLELLNIKER